jgi:hypothetical protein
LQEKRHLLARSLGGPRWDRGFSLVFQLDSNHLSHQLMQLVRGLCAAHASQALQQVDPEPLESFAPC